MKPDDSIHPVEVCILAAIVLCLASLELVRVGLALVLMVARLACRRAEPAATLAPPPCPRAPADAPWRHPLIVLAEEMATLPAAELRSIAGTRRRCGKADLIAIFLAMPV